MAKKKAIITEAPEEGFAHHYGMVLGALVAIVGVVGLVILLSGEITGNVLQMNNVGENVCSSECGPGWVGMPMGHHGPDGIKYCICRPAE